MSCVNGGDIRTKFKIALCEFLAGIRILEQDQPAVGLSAWSIMAASVLREGGCLLFSKSSLFPMVFQPVEDIFNGVNSKAEYSIRINEQYRICFVWGDPSLSHIIFPSTLT